MSKRKWKGKYNKWLGDRRGNCWVFRASVPEKKGLSQHLKKSGM